MGVLPVEHREITPRISGSVQTLKFIRDPLRLFVLGCQFDDADAFALRARWGKQLVREVGAYFVLCDHLGCHAQDVGRGAVILGQRDAKWRGVLAGLPACEAFEEKFKTAKGCAAKSVNRLVVVAYDYNVARLWR